MTNIDVYVDWANDWLTIEKMAEYYGISEDDLRIRIDKGREDYNSINQ